MKAGEPVVSHTWSEELGPLGMGIHAWLCGLSQLKLTRLNASGSEEKPLLLLIAGDSWGEGVNYVMLRPAPGLSFGCSLRRLQKVDGPQKCRVHCTVPLKSHQKPHHTHLVSQGVREMTTVPHFQLPPVRFNLSVTWHRGLKSSSYQCSAT